MLSDEIRRAILARDDWKAKERKGRVHFLCPRHDDNKPSAWMGGGAWGCFACGFEESIATLAPLVGVETKGKGDYTLETYADEKRLSADRLRGWGLDTHQVNGRKVLRIPYCDEEGSKLRDRYRSWGSQWWEGRDRPIHLYGRDRLVDARPGDPVIVVEGESDCHALWSEGLLAVGIPGATCWKSRWSKHLAGLDVYVWEEPDQGGAQLVEAVTADIPDAKIIRDPPAKDPAELRVSTNGDLAAEIRKLMHMARAANAPEPPVAYDVLLEDRFERLLEHQLSPIDAVPTPFPTWNNLCRDEGGGVGLAKGWAVLAAARTGTGKSILSLNVAARAMKAGERVCFISLEMSQRQVEVRLMAIVGEVAVRNIEKGRWFDRDTFRGASRAFGRIQRETGGVFITNRSPIYRIDQVVSSIRAMHEIHGAEFFIVDYLQLAGNPNDPESITQVSHRVREQARDLRVVTFGLSQFNRSTSASNETPTVHGLMGTSELENAADQVVLLDHTKVTGVQLPATGASGWATEALLGKQRHGPTGSWPILFRSDTLAMREMMPDEVPHELKEKG